MKQSRSMLDVYLSYNIVRDAAVKVYVLLCTDIHSLVFVMQSSCNFKNRYLILCFQCIYSSVLVA